MKVNWQNEISGYFSALFSTEKHGDAREESFYPALRSFLETAATALAKTMRLQSELSDEYPSVETLVFIPSRDEAGVPDLSRKVSAKRDFRHRPRNLPACL